jgi:DNA topoisomerase-3
MTRLLQTGKTALLDGFVSNKTRRKFKAYLAWDAKEGKVGFEFEPRPERPGAKTAARGPARAAAGEAAAAAAPMAPAKKAVRKVARKAAPGK